MSTWVPRSALRSSERRAVAEAVRGAIALSLIVELDECFWFGDEAATCRAVALHAKGQADIAHYKIDGQQLAIRLRTVWFVEPFPHLVEAERLRHPEPHCEDHCLRQF
jgi:hypothetical protein